MITIHRTLTVSENTASLNEPLYMFRGDGDISIILDLIQTIKNMKPGKVSSTNVITDGLIYSTVCIYKPSGELAFVAKGEIVENQMQVTQLKDVMDEVIEIGEHKLQIHLFDEDENRLTLPEVGQIYIAEPLCKNSHIEPINTTAIVGSSTVGTCVVADDPAILADGYLTYDWQTGEYITSAKLNNMIMGIDEALSGIKIVFSDYAKTTDIPTKTSELTNDSNFLTSIPSEYVTETELNAKGYLTEHQSLEDYAKTTDIPTKTSELTNDSNFLTSIPSEYVTETELINKIGQLEARIQALEAEYDSLIPIVGTVNEDNAITIFDTLQSGIYALRYIFEDGTQEELEEFTVSEDVNQINLMEEAEIQLNMRYSSSKGDYITANGVVCFTIPFTNYSGNAMRLEFDNLAHSMLGSNCLLYILDNDKSNPSVVNENCDFNKMTSGVESAYDGLSGTVTFTPPINEGYITTCVRTKDDGTEATEDEFKDYIVILTMGVSN